MMVRVEQVLSPDGGSDSGGVDPPAGDEYLSAADAMKFLGVSAQTLYAYVSRKGIRSRPIPGSRQRRYWKSDLEQLRQKRPFLECGVPEYMRQSEITLIAENALFYRGQDAAKLAQSASFETVAALLWGVPAAQVFEDIPPKTPPAWLRLNKLLAAESTINRATAILPLFEEANPRSFDLSHPGMARTGADILRALAAITVRAEKPTAEPIHLFLARELKLSAVKADMIRRLLVLSADHGFERGVHAVRALASTGVTPWRAVIGGISVILGRRGKLADFDSTSRLVREIIASPEPRSVIVQRMRVSDSLPGFGSPVYPRGDPRARALLNYCRELFPKDEALLRLSQAVQTAKDINGAEPGLALASIVIGIKLGFGPDFSLFHVGRAAGWIAHAIEQYQFGEVKREKGLYRGPLP
jgi:citrate synthase